MKFTLVLDRIDSIMIDPSSSHTTAIVMINKDDVLASMPKGNALERLIFGGVDLSDAFSS